MPAAAAAATAALGHTGARHAVPGHTGARHAVLSREGSATARGPAVRMGFQEVERPAWGFEGYGGERFPALRTEAKEKAWGVPERAGAGPCDSHWEVPLRCFGFIWEAVESRQRSQQDRVRCRSHKGPPGDSSAGREAGCGDNGLEAACRPGSEHFCPPPVSRILSFTLLREPALAITS